MRQADHEQGQCRTDDEDGKQDELARALVADRERLDCAQASSTTPITREAGPAERLRRSAASAVASIPPPTTTTRTTPGTR